MSSTVKLSDKKTRMIGIIAVTITCVLLGAVVAVQYKSLSATDKIITTDSEKITSLQEQLIRLDRENEILENENEKLSQQLVLLESATNEEQIENLSNELNKIKTFAGATKVSGSGLYISINTKVAVLPNTLQRHLLSLINELKACTAQAISINGERLTAMTEIRVRGDNAVVINGRQHSLPLSIYAIGKPQDMLSGMLLNGDGPLALLAKDNSFEIEYQIQDNIEVEACKSEDVVINMLQNAG